MVKNRLVMKKCPECRHSAALASKLCGNLDCGYSFYDAKQMQTRATEEKPRRTKRARRENPNYSGSVDLEAEKNKRQKLHHYNDSQNIPPRRTSDFGSEDAMAEKNGNEKTQQKPHKSNSQEAPPAPPRRTSGRTKESKEIQMENRRKRLQEIKDRREDLCGQLSQGKQELVAFFLSEINRKFASVAWKP